MEKEVAIDILKDVRNSLMKENWKEETLKTIAIYRKGLEIANNQKIEELIKRYKEYKEKYGENDRKTLKISKKIDDKIREIYSN